jgi:cytoskeletal protein RodZ
MNETFGTRLRLQREGQQIPLATIAEQTKIKLSLLEGLERDDVSRWPTGIFRRSYFRAYARAIGLEPDRVLPEFQALYPDPATEDNVTEVLAQARNVPRRPPTRLRCLIDSAVNALPALHLQPTFKSVPTGVRTESNPPVEQPVLEVAAPPPPVLELDPPAEAIVEVAPPPPPPSPKIRPNIQYSQEPQEKSGVDFAAVAQ